MKSTRHSALCKAVRDLLTVWGCVSFPVKQGPTPFTRKDGTTGYRRGALRAGVSDVCACGPRGRFVAVECKVGRDKVRPAQDEFLAAVRKAGGVAIIARDTVEAVLAAKAEIGMPRA